VPSQRTSMPFIILDRATVTDISSVSSANVETEQAIRKPSTIKKIYNYTHHFWIIVIAADLFAQMFRRSIMDEREVRMLDQMELFVTMILLFEIVFRFVSDWRGFHTQRRNWVDLFLAVVTAIILLPPIKNSGRPYDWLTIFQILRVYRLVWAIPVTRNLLVCHSCPENMCAY
jgi:ABC-type bacteriocin/lantibiotic exporter with double-glycine peptidase domain